MIPNSKDALVAYLLKNGKRDEDSWENLASKFGLRSAETARNIWKKHRLTDSNFGKRIQTTPDGSKKVYVDKAPCPVVRSFSENVENETAEITCKSDTEIRTLEELIEKTKIDVKKWKITRYVQNYWGNTNDPHWQVKAFLEARTKQEKTTEEFIEFLKTYKPQPKIQRKDREFEDRWICVVINKQDAHLNKFDIKGDNSIDGRFNRIENYVDEVLNKAEKVGSIDKIVYILGSDQFNSEWTNTTTKGTPQQNIHTYHDAFARICNHEISVINMLLESCMELEIIYIPGNHDEFVGWHMVNWLKAFYRNQSGLKINDSPSYTKYIKYHNTAMMFNHGDDAKPSKLAGIFPMEFKEWSECKYYYIFTGDKHVEQNNDFNGIKHYQIPALSKAHGNWDSKKGYTTVKAELTTFVIDRCGGLTDIFKQTL